MHYVTGYLYSKARSSDKPLLRVMQVSAAVKLMQVFKLVFKSQANKKVQVT